MYSPGAEEGAWFADSCGGPGAQEQCDSWGQGAVAGEGRPECALTLLVPLLLGAWLHLTSERQHLKRGIKSKGRSLLHPLWNLEEAFCSRCFPGGVVVKKEKKKGCLPVQEDSRNAGWIPGSARSPAGGNGNPPQHSCPEDPMDRGAWRAIVHAIARSRARLSMHTGPDRDRRFIDRRFI